MGGVSGWVQAAGAGGEKESKLKLKIYRRRGKEADTDSGACRRESQRVGSGHFVRRYSWSCEGLVVSWSQLSSKAPTRPITRPRRPGAADPQAVTPSSSSEFLAHQRYPDLTKPASLPPPPSPIASANCSPTTSTPRVKAPPPPPPPHRRHHTAAAPPCPGLLHRDPNHTTTPSSRARGPRPVALPPSISAMSLVNLAHVCSHLQNASKAHLGLTSVPLTKLHLTLALGLQKQGFISSVSPGGPTPPPTFALREPPTGGPSAEQLEREPWAAYPAPGVGDAAEDAQAQTIPTNKALQRLWLGLKYWNNEPVLNKMTLISKPTKRIWLNSNDLGIIVRGQEAGQVKGLTRPGECLFVTTHRGVLEARECVEKKLGGMILCRVL